MRIYYLVLFLFPFCLPLAAQTFTVTGGPVPDDGTTVTFPLTVSGLPGSVDTLNFGLERVCFNAYHTWNSDLAVSLRAPNGMVLPLFSGVGGDTDGFENTCLSGNAAASIFSAAWPFTGEFRPTGDMGTLNNGLDPNGVWELVVYDTYPFADAGGISDWSITFGDEPCQPFPFASSDLPIVKIETGGQLIIDEPKIAATLTVIDNGPGQRNYANQTTAAFYGPIGVELHGNSTLGFPKKSLRFETWDDQENDLDVSLLGLPETSDFVLSANYSDKTLLRNALTYELSRATGRYAPRTRFCEVVVNNTYQGVYVLTERIRRGDDRVDIARLRPEDTSGVDLTGGYIVSIDWVNTPNAWTSNFAQPNNPDAFVTFQHEYPRAEAIQPVQAAYIRQYIDSFEVALAGPQLADTTVGWRRFADERSFIDFLIVNELSRNVDGYRLSTYFYKDRDDRGGKLHMGPLWDFDLAWYNADYCEAWLPTGWAYNLNYVCPGDVGVPFWWERLMDDDPAFRERLACRWQSLRRQALHRDSLFATIDSMAAVLDESQQRNFDYWPILGVYVWPNPGPLPTTYAGEIQKLKNWIDQRLAWLDATLNAELPAIGAEFQTAGAGGLTLQFTAEQNGLATYTWDFGDGATASGATVQHTFAVAGVYPVSLTVTTEWGCSATDEQTLALVDVGTGEAPRAAAPRLRPNPAHDWLEISWPAGAPATAVRLVLENSLGQTVLDAATIDPRARIALPLLPAGVYAARVHDGRTWWINRVVIER